MRIIVSLPIDRLKNGTVNGYDDRGQLIAGPFACDGKSDDAAAIAAGNPTRDPTKSFGDTPTGEYTATLGSVSNTPQNVRSYGTPNSTGVIPVIWLQPVMGDGTSQAWQRQRSESLAKGHPVNMGLAIHAGELNGAGTMRPTHGCVRMIEQSFIQILAALIPGTFSVLIQQL